MGRNKFIKDPDFFYDRNQGFTALKPNPNGRFANLVQRRIHNNEEQCWLFCDAPSSLHFTMDEVPNHHLRGIRVGSLEDFETFKSMLECLDITVGSRTFEVPCSNGEKRCDDHHARQPMRDFFDRELMMLRFDLPTEEQLTEMLEAMS